MCCLTSLGAHMAGNSNFSSLLHLASNDHENTVSIDLRITDKLPSRRIFKYKICE